MKWSSFIKLAAVCCVLIGSAFAVWIINKNRTGMEIAESKKNFQLTRRAAESHGISGTKINPPEAAEEKQSTSITFFGDMMFDRYIRQVADKKSVPYLFEKSEQMLMESGMNVANLEGPVADRVSVSIDTKLGDKGHFSFVFDPAILTHLKKLRFDAVHIGNNHILNFGVSGLGETRSYLTQNDIAYFGSPGESAPHFTQTIEGHEVALVSYNQFGEAGEQRTIENISAAKNSADFVIVYAHWGEEYKTAPNAAQIRLAHACIDVGADAVIGSHPHVIQNIEQYQGKYIFYSLGNFVFDQYFSKGTMEGMGVRINYAGPAKLSYHLIPILMKSSGQVEPMAGGNESKFLARLADKATVPEEIKKLISAGTIR